MKKKNILLAGIASMAVIAVTAYCIVRKRKNSGEEKPPRRAPQVPIQNPGDQSEFPAAPTGQIELG